MYCGADIPQNSKGCCSEAQTEGTGEREKRRKLESFSVKVPRIMYDSHAIDNQKDESLCQADRLSPTGCSEYTLPNRV